MQKIEDDIKRVQKEGLPINKYADNCPKCKKGFVVKRKNDKGEFKGCTEYPSCDYVEAISKKRVVKRSRPMTKI